MEGCRTVLVFQTSSAEIVQRRRERQRDHAGGELISEGTTRGRQSNTAPIDQERRAGDTHPGSLSLGLHRAPPNNRRVPWTRVTVKCLSRTHLAPSYTSHVSAVVGSCRLTSPLIRLFPTAMSAAGAVREVDERTRQWTGGRTSIGTRQRTQQHGGSIRGTYIVPLLLPKRHRRLNGGWVRNRKASSLSFHLGEDP
jgi:hypothetical protein